MKLTLSLGKNVSCLFLHSSNSVLPFFPLSTLPSTLLRWSFDSTWSSYFLLFLLRPYFFPVVKIEEVSYLKNLLASAFQRLSWSDPPLSSLLNLCSCWIFFSSYKQALVSTINKIKRKRKKLSWFFNPPDSLTFPCSS